MIGVSLSVPSIATLSKGVPFRLTIGGLVFERVTLDGVLVEIDGLPLYMEI